MKRIIWAFLTVIFLVGASSCKEIRRKLLPAFSVNVPPIPLTIPPIAFISKDEVPIGALKTHINMDSTIRANTRGAFGAGAVTSVHVKNIVIKATNADEQNNLSNFERGRMRIYSDNDTAAVDIANIAFPATYTDSIAVTNTNGPDISNYLKGSQLSYNLFWTNRRTTNKRLKLIVSVTLSVQ